MKRFHYIVTARNSASGIEEGSPYRIASAQIRAKSMDHALEVAMQSEGITRERNPMWTQRVAFDLYRQGKRVGVYITPVVDDMES
jgi:hypothetical protein